MKRKDFKPREEERYKQRERFQRFYQSKEWKRLRLYVLAEQPLCVNCLASGFTVAGFHVDHIVPLQEDYNRRLILTTLTFYVIATIAKKS
jgi:5-methylcytosine-specific restriction protein A